VVIELAADARFARDLAAGGVFVPGCALRLSDECDLVVRGSNHQLVLPARVVYVEGSLGAGLELLGFSTELRAQLAELDPPGRPSQALDAPVLVESAADESLHDAAPLPDDLDLYGVTEPIPVILEPYDDDLAVPIADPAEARSDTEEHAQVDGDGDAYSYADDNADTDAGQTHRPGQDRELEEPLGDYIDTAAYPHVTSAGELAELDARHGGGGDDEVDPVTLRARGKPTQSLPRNIHDRLRGLTLVAQVKLAVSGELHERIMLERLYGKNVWETLLRNPRLTPPEVSRIARYGSLPRVLLEIIVGNNAWLQVPEVRRALLSNPRLGTDQIVKVLRLTPKHELKLAAIQTAYPVAVRSAARLLLKGD
jgi:hypothetical protein